MKRIFIDTSFLVAYHHKGDPFHKTARDVLTKEIAELIPFRLVITDYVFDEFVTVIQKKVSKKDAIETGRTLLNDVDFDLERIKDNYFDNAWEVFCKFQDKRWSFTDCTSYVWIKQNRPDFCLATDPDFDQFGLVPNLARS